MHALKAATGVRGVFPKRPLNLRIINMGEMPVKLPKNQQVTTANCPAPSVIHCKTKWPFPYSPDLAVTKSINVAHYTPKPSKMQQI